MFGLTLSRLAKHGTHSPVLWYPLAGPEDGSGSTDLGRAVDGLPILFGQVTGNPYPTNRSRRGSRVWRTVLPASTAPMQPQQQLAM